MGLCASRPRERVVSVSLVPKYAAAPPSDSSSGAKIASSGGKAAPPPAGEASSGAAEVAANGAAVPAGPPPPIMLADCSKFELELERQGAVQALGVVDTPIDDPRFNAITKLMSSIFQTPVALITLITEDRVWFKSKVGPFGACVVREGSWCNYISIPNAPEVLITEDASEDARFAGNPYVAGAPFIKFYAGAPLVGKKGMRYGTLCIVDLKRRSFSAEMYALLCNFANLVVQELERDAASMREVQEEAAQLAEGQQRLERLVGSTSRGVALVDVRSRAWPVLYANAAFAAAEGGGEDEEGGDSCTSRGFWDLFEPADTTSQGEMMKAVDAAVAAGRPARASVVSKRSGEQLTVVLRPGASDQLAPGKAIGIPNWVPSELAMDAGCHAGALPGGLDDGGDIFEGPAGTHTTPTPQLATCFWFVAVEGPGIGSSNSSPATSSAYSAAATPGGPSTPNGGVAPAPRAARKALQTFAGQQQPESLEGLQMGPLVGSGSFGRVYRGMWRGRAVAVKLIDCACGSQGPSSSSSASASASSGPSASEAALAEAQLSKSLDHPAIVKTFEYAMMPAKAKSSAPPGAQPGGVLWMVQQLCNHGTLNEAVDRGWMRVRRSLVAPPDLPAMLRTLREVASGMAYLHSKNILHCDLTGNNVLLEAVEDGAAAAAAGDHRGFRARVCDFGLAKVAKGGHLTTSNFGTCSHMAPELMSDGVLTPAADVWSFGVIAWEMYSGVRAYVGHRMPHIVYLVTSGRGTLRLPEGAPPGYQALMGSCFAKDRNQRPSFDELVAGIDVLLESGEVATVAAPAPGGDWGPCKAVADKATAVADAATAAAGIAAAGQAVVTPPQ